jgi:regulator of cell morphogenesis and NO signaling
MKTSTHRVSQDLTVAQVALRFPKSLAILQRHHLDFCCGGHESLVTACAAIGLDPDLLWSELAKESDRHTDVVNADALDTNQVIKVIVERHHSYVRQAIPEIQMLLDKVCAAHGDTNTSLLVLRTDFKRISKALLTHMDIEEREVFPAVSAQLQEDGGYYHVFTHRPEVQLQELESDHDLAGLLIKKIRQLTSDYAAPGHACATWRAAFEKLREFDIDLMTHVHLENNVLFERVRGAGR